MKKMVISSMLMLSMTAFVINFCACGNKAAEEAGRQPEQAPVPEHVVAQEPAAHGTESATRGGLTNGEVVEIASEDQFTQLTAQGNVVVDFYAKWCPPCKALSPVIHDLAKENKHITFIKVDTDQFNALSSKFGVKGLPTLIFLKNGLKVSSTTGSQSKNTLQEKLNNVFSR